MDIRSRLFFLLFPCCFYTSCLFAQETIDINDYNQNVSLTNEGWASIEKGEYQVAVEKFEKAIDFNQNNADSYVGASTAYLYLDEFDKARDRIDSALVLSKNQSDIYYLAGNIHFRTGNYKEAIDHYSQALSLNDQSEVKINKIHCLFNRANAHIRMENYLQAVKDLNQVLSVKGDFMDAYHNRAVALKHLSKKEDACRDFDAAVHFGSQKSMTYLTGYCKNVAFNPLDYSTIRVVDQGPGEDNIIDSNIPTGYEQSGDDLTFSQNTDVLDTIYFHDDWTLCGASDYSFYRVAKVNRLKRYFIGSFVDYHRNGGLLVKGVYDENGVKDGLFERFYENGNIYSSGNYIDNIQVGEWKFYNEDGSLSETIEFTEEDYYVLHSIDPNGKPGVVSKSGTWRKIISEGGKVKYKLTGKFKDGKKVGIWKVTTTGGKILHIEKYKDNVFYSAEMRGAFGDMVISTQLFGKDFFYPQSFAAIEEFQPGFDMYPAEFVDDLPNTSFIAESDTGFIKAQYPGGMAGFYSFLGMNIRYPDAARVKSVSGKVYVKFSISKDGAVEKVEVIKGLGHGLDEEAIRVISLCPNWIPARKDGVRVVDSMVLPITFRHEGVVRIDGK